VRAHSSDVQWVIHNFTHREIVRAEPRADVPGSEGAVAGARRVDPPRGRRCVQAPPSKAEPYARH